MTKHKEATPQTMDIPEDVAAAAAKLNDVAWRDFPQFEETFKGETLQQMCGKIERTCKELDRTIQSGSAREKARAKAAMQAYGLTMELLKQVGDLREKYAASRRR